MKKVYVLIPYDEIEDNLEYIESKFNEPITIMNVRWFTYDADVVNEKEIFLRDVRQLLNSDILYIPRPYPEFKLEEYTLLEGIAFCYHIPIIHQEKEENYA